MTNTAPSTQGSTSSKAQTNMALRVAAVWGTTVLEMRTLTRGQTFWLGDMPGCVMAMPEGVDMSPSPLRGSPAGGWDLDARGASIEDERGLAGTSRHVVQRHRPRTKTRLEPRRRDHLVEGGRVRCLGLDRYFQRLRDRKSDRVIDRVPSKWRHVCLRSARNVIRILLRGIRPTRQGDGRKVLVAREVRCKRKPTIRGFIRRASRHARADQKESAHSRLHQPILYALRMRTQVPEEKIG